MIKKENPMLEMVSYIKNNLKKGYTKDSLKYALLSQGYSRLEVEKALRKVDSDLASQAPLLKTKPKISYEAYPISEKDSDEQVINKVKLKMEKPTSSFWKNLFGF